MGLLGARKTVILNPPRSTAFSPASVSGMLLWWDPSDTSTLTLSGNELLTMADKSGNGYTATTPGATGPDSSTVTINSLNALEVATAGEYLSVSSLPLGDTNHIFIVASADAVAGQTELGLVGFNDASGTNFDWRWRNRTASEFNVSYRALGGNTTTSFEEAALPDRSGLHLFEIAHDPVADTVTMYVDGTQRAQGTNYTQSGAFSGQFVVMANEALGTLTGDLGEVLVYTAVLTGTDLTNVRAYLKNKWGTP